MGITSFGLTAPYIPRLGMVSLTATQIGSLEAVIEKKGEAAADWRFETGVVGIVLRTADPDQRIHVAYTEEELTDTTFSDSTISGRTSAEHEIGFVGIGTPLHSNNKKYNVYFRATTAAGAAAVSKIFVELYFNIA